MNTSHLTKPFNKSVMSLNRLPGGHSSKHGRGPAEGFREIPQDLQAYAEII